MTNLYLLHTDPSKLDYFDEIGQYVNEYGDLEFRNELGQLHRDDDKPASLTVSGTGWYQNGKLHRDGDKPAYIDNNGKWWIRNGVLHRDGNQPAVIKKDGTKEWWDNGQQIAVSRPSKIKTAIGRIARKLGYKKD
jgi:hypothetical protein